MLHCCFVLTQHDKQLAKAVGKLFGKTLHHGRLSSIKTRHSEKQLSVFYSKIENKRCLPSSKNPQRRFPKGI